MKNLLLITALCILSLAVSAQEAKSNMPNQADSAQSTAMAGNDLKTQFAPVMSAYYGLKNALVADKGATAAEQGKALDKALENLDTKSWTIQQRNDYTPLAKKLETDAEHIGANAAKIDHQREHFESLSTNLFAVVKALKINSAPVYWEYCPMKKASWMSAENTVKNPYYGKQMLTCGSVKETVN